jgi:hypothetical protein
MLRFLAEGDRRHRLERGDGTPVGHISGQTIRIIGLTSEDEACDAAAPVRRAFDAALAQQYPGWRRDGSSDARRLVHDGAYEWISDGNSPIARLIRPRADRSTDESFAIEFVLPSYANEGVAIAAADTMVRALDEFRSARAAAAWRHDGRAEAPLASSH